MAHYRRPPPWKTPSRSPGQQNTNKTNKKDIPTTRGLQVPQKGPERKNNKGKSNKTEQNSIDTQFTVPMSFPP